MNVTFVSDMQILKNQRWLFTLTMYLEQKWWELELLPGDFQNTSQGHLWYVIIIFSMWNLPIQWDPRRWGWAFLVMPPVLWSSSPLELNSSITILDNYLIIVLKILLFKGAYGEGKEDWMFSQRNDQGISGGVWLKLLGFFVCFGVCVCVYLCTCYVIYL